MEETLMTKAVQETDDGLSKLEPGSPEFERQANALAKLSEARTKEIKAQAEIDDMEAKRELESKSETRRTLIDALKVGAMVALTVAGMWLRQRELDQTAEFEETGVWRSSARKKASEKPEIYKF